MTTQFYNTVGQSVLFGGYKVFVDYGFAKIFMHTPAGTAAMFGALEGVVTHIVVKNAAEEIMKSDSQHDTIVSGFGKLIAIAAIFFISIKADQTLLTLVGYPISYQAAGFLGVLNMSSYLPIILIAKLCSLD